MRMAADDHIDIEIGKELCVLKLLIVRLGRIFRTPMHVDHHCIGYLLRPLDFVLHDRFVELARVVLVGEVVGILAVEIVTVRVAEQRNSRPIAFDHVHRVAIALREIASDNHDFGVLREQLVRPLNAERTHIPRVVRVEVGDVESFVRNRVNRRIRRVENGITRILIAVSVAGARRLLVDEAQVVTVDFISHRLIVRFEIVVDTRSLAILRQYGEVHVRGEHVTNCCKRNHAWVGARLTSSVHNIVDAVGRGAMNDAVIVDRFFSSSEFGLLRRLLRIRSRCDAET